MRLQGFDCAGAVQFSTDGETYSGYVCADTWGKTGGANAPKKEKKEEGKLPGRPPPAVLYLREMPTFYSKYFLCN